MTDDDEDALRARLHVLANRFLLMGGPNVADAVDLACDLVVAGLDTPTTISVAALQRNAILSDSEQLLLSMLSEQGIEVSQPCSEEERFVALRHAFGFWDLPMHHFEGACYGQIPEWDKQDSLERALVILLDQRDNESDRRAGRRSRRKCALRSEMPPRQTSGDPFGA